MLKEFKAFVLRGNVMDLAVAVIIGAAFGRIVSSLTDDVIMPIVGSIFGGLDFSSYFIRLGDIPAGYAGSTTNYAQLKAAGVPPLGYGLFITEAVNFVILAFIIFLMMRWVSRLMKTAPAAPSPDVVLLTEIRDELRKRT